MICGPGRAIPEKERSTGSHHCTGDLNEFLPLNLNQPGPGRPRPASVLDSAAARGRRVLHVGPGPGLSESGG
jgi:hypothetical protein